MQDKKISRLELIEWLEGHKKDAELMEWDGEVAAFEFVINTLSDSNWALLKDN
jgi:hypothetical protein